MAAREHFLEDEAKAKVETPIAESEMDKIDLDGTPPGSDNRNRVDYMKTWLDKVMAKENHISSARQRNITIALVIFAGIFSFRLKSPEAINTFFSSLSLTVLMFIFCVLDRRLHKLTHGWRKARRTIVHRIAKAINNPQQGISFLVYDSEAKNEAEWFSLQPIIHYFLVAGGVLSYFV